MNTKLQELTEKLYQEGLSKGKNEGEQILAQANAEAEAILSKARSEAEAIIAKAEADAAALKSKAESDIRVASEQSLQSTRKQIENILVSSISAGTVSAKLQDASFLESIITEVAKKFDTQESQDLSLILPEALQSELQPWVASQLSKELKAGVSAGFSKKIAGGFTIGPKDGSYYVSLTDETFKALIAEYLRPVTRKLLFGE